MVVKVIKRNCSTGQTRSPAGKSKMQSNPSGKWTSQPRSHTPETSRDQKARGRNVLGLGLTGPGTVPETRIYIR